MWRESLEAALIVGILLTYLARSGERAGMRYVWAGALGAVVAAVAMGLASNGAAARLGPDAQELLQAGVLLLAVGVLSWMVVWMHRNARQIGGDLRRRADRALATGRLVGLAAIAFAAVFREGVEAVLFLWGVVVQRANASAPALLAAGVAGAGLAVRPSGGRRARRPRRRPEQPWRLRRTIRGLRAACSLLPPAACLQARLVGRRCACRSRSPARSPRSPWLLRQPPSRSPPCARPPHSSSARPSPCCRRPCRCWPSTSSSSRSTRRAPRGRACTRWRT